MSPWEMVFMKYLCSLLFPWAEEYLSQPLSCSGEEDSRAETQDFTLSLLKCKSDKLI